MNMLLTNSELTSRTFSLLQKHHGELAKDLDAALKESYSGIEKLQEKMSAKGLSFQEFGEFTVSSIGHIYLHMNQNQERTYRLLELVCLNCIQLNKKVDELILALSSADSKRNRSRINRLAKNIEQDKKEFNKRLNSIRDSMRATKWLYRRLEDMKKGSPNERI